MVILFMTKQMLIPSRTCKTNTELTIVCYLYVNKVCVMVLSILVEYTGKNCFSMLKTSTIKVFYEIYSRYRLFTCRQVQGRPSGVFVDQELQTCS